VFDFVERSLRSHPRINPSTQPSDGAGTSKAVLELTLIVLSGEKLFFGVLRSEFASIFQVGVVRINTAISPLSLRERVRVRAGFGVQ
jgi:hypothetical protein